MSPPLSPEDLYSQFMEYRQRKQYDDDANGPYNSAEEFEYLTTVHHEVLSNLKSSRPLTDSDSHMYRRLEVMLREERNTWRLAKALLKDQLLTKEEQHNGSDVMDDGFSIKHNGSLDHHFDDELAVDHPAISEDQVIVNFYLADSEIRRMQIVCDWLEANEASDLGDNDVKDKVESYSEGPTAWECTFHAMRANYNINISDLDITVNPNTGTDLCSAMDPDAPIRTKKPLAHSDKEVEIKLFKNLLRYIRAGKLDDGQKLAKRVGYHWLAAILDGWLPLQDENLDAEHLGTVAIHQPSEIKPVIGNKKRDVWKQTCFKASRMHGLASYEKAILGVLGGNLKSVLPVCNSWADQLWARLRCSIDVKIEKALRNPNFVPQENRDRIDYPQEFYDSYQDLQNIFKSMKDMKIVSPYKEATIHQTIQRHLMLNNIDGLLEQLKDWCTRLEYDNNLGENNEAISPQFLRFYAHLILFLREINLVTADDSRGAKIIESYIGLLTQHKSIDGVAYYTVFLPRDNQIVSYAKLLATISGPEERKHCLKIAKDYKLDIDEITQTVVELILEEPSGQVPTNTSASDIESTKTTPNDRRKIDSLDYLLYLEPKNYVAILHRGNVLLRHFALQRKMEAVKEVFLKLPIDLNQRVENQWRLHTDKNIIPSLRNNMRELEGFKVLLEAQEELAQWSEWHRKKPEEPKKPANLSKFCDNVNYEQRLKQYQQDLNLWEGLREMRTKALATKVQELCYFQAGWMIDLPTGDNMTDSEAERLNQMAKLRKIFIPQMITICFNVLHLTNRHEDCLEVSHLLADESLKLYAEFTKAQLRDFLDKISEVTKIIVRKSISESS